MDLDHLPLAADAEATQTRLAPRVHRPARPEDGYRPAPGDVVVSLDIQYDGDDAHVAAHLHRHGGASLGVYAAVTPATFPYIPGYFCFREGPPLLALVHHLTTLGLPPLNVLVVDGHGLAHPRRFGVACWLGLATSLPTVGCAKSTLIHVDAEPAAERGSTTAVRLDDELVGVVLRTQDGVNPLYVSPGHAIHLEPAVALVMGMDGPYRLPDPLRAADEAARAHCRGAHGSGMTDLGAIPPVAPPW